MCISGDLLLHFFQVGPGHLQVEKWTSGDEKWRRLTLRARRITSGHVRARRNLSGRAIVRVCAFRLCFFGYLPISGVH